MRRILAVVLTFLFSATFAFSQNAAGSSYWLKLKDKKGTNYQISHPEAFLSKRSINRRVKQHIPIDETDLPVSSVYLDSLRKCGLEILHSSKWLNGVTVRTPDTALIRQTGKLTFVSEIQLTKPAAALKSGVIKFNEEETIAAFDETKYGIALAQLTQLNGRYLHDRGIRGKGIQIAVLDAGFWHVNGIEAFDSLRNSNRIMGTHDFVDPKSDFYHQHTHGMSVLSCMGGNLPGTMIGTAPDASYYLFRSEDSSTEYLIEEDNWVAAAELADSLGVDVINSSLGYSEFDDPRMDHLYSDMNGKKSRVTQGANMAFQKGILVFSSAGNEGKETWKYIIAPSDGENVIAVAAVDKDGIRASFSSVGPAFGGAIKPNVAATGSSTFLVTSFGQLGYSSGTSFSSPVLAGMGACLLQSNPWATVKQVKMAIEQSGCQYSNPDSLLGYGIPDFAKADIYLKVNGNKALKTDAEWQVSPNPFNNRLFIQNLNPLSDDNCQISIYNLQGICLLQSTFKTSGSIFLTDLANLPVGILFLSIRCGIKEERIKLIKTVR